MDAGLMFASERAAKCLQEGWRIQHISDRVRMEALANGGGWFGDMDQLWISKDRLVWNEKCMGYLACSVQVLRTRKSKKTWLTDYLRTQKEELWFSVPVHFPSDSPLLASALVCFSAPVSSRLELQPQQDSSSSSKSHTGQLNSCLI